MSQSSKAALYANRARVVGLISARFAGRAAGRGGVSALVAGAGLCALGCVGVPDPPPPAEDLSGLAARYERPTAVIPDELVRALVTVARELLGPYVAFTGLHFTRESITDTSVGLAEHANVEDLELQGRVDATVQCPGDGTESAEAQAPGTVYARFGVRNSRLSRGFSGSVADCRFPIVSNFGATQRVLLSADYVADLGGDLELGSPAPQNLVVKLTHATGTSTGPKHEIDLTRDEYDFRLTGEDAVEVLFDSAALGRGDLGSVVLMLRADGFIGLRESRGLWSCEGGEQECVITR